MRLALVALAATFVLSSAQAHSTICVPRLVEILVGDGVQAGSLYHIDYCPENGLCDDDWLYLENGALPGVQTGAYHAVLDATVLGVFWGHDHRCVWPVEAERDYFLY